MQFVNWCKGGIVLLALLGGLSIFSTEKKPSNSFYEADYYYVLAHSGLSLREQPSSDSLKLKKIPYNTKIVVEKFTDVKNTFQGIKNRWARVRYNGTTGFVFSGFLSRLKGPRYNIRSLQLYAFETFKQIEKTVLTEEGGTAEKQGKFYSAKKVTKFEKNITFITYFDYENGGEDLYLPNFTFQEAFLIGINLDSRYKKFSYKPDSDNSYWQCFIDSDGCVEKGDCLQLDRSSTGQIFVSISWWC
ncbi:MAG: SH3 domain-containing protein [Leptospirales bacterium]